MKKILLFILVLINLKSIAQIENYIAYQKQINLAELNLIRNEKEKSFSIYFATITKFKGNFCKDIYNALLLASELDKTKEFFILLDFLCSKGLDNKYINKQEEFKKYHTHNKWEKFLTKNTQKTNINKDLKRKIDSLHIEDQFYRPMFALHNKYGDTIKIIDSLNMEFIYQLISLNKFPGEDEIGVRDIRGENGFDIVFHHYAQSTSLDKNKYKITPIIVNLVHEGKLMPNKACHWLEMQNSDFEAGVFGVRNYNVDGKDTEYYIPIYDERKKILINQYRKWLGMETLEEYYEKFLYVVKNKESKYVFDVLRNSFHVDKKMFEDMSKNAIILK